MKGREDEGRKGNIHLICAVTDVIVRCSEVK